MSSEPYTVWKTGTEVLSIIGLVTVFLVSYMVYQKLWGKKKVAKRAPRAASAGTPRPKATPRRRLAAAPPLVPHFHIPATPSVRDLLAQHYGATPVKAEPAA
ncbi:hypothetical protein AB1N83_003447 [Pleurotus pulmonarius]